MMDHRGYEMALQEKDARIESLRQQLAEAHKETDSVVYARDEAYRMLAECERERDDLVEFVNEVRRTGDTRLASMAIATLAKVGADKGEV